MPLRRSASPPDPEHLRSVLARSPLFGPLPEAVRHEVSERMEWCYLPGGEALLRPGDPSHWLYLVVHGRVRVYYDLDDSGAFDPHEAVDEIVEGGIVGDVAMLSDDPHEALVLAVRDTEVGRLPEAVFWELAVTHPPLVRRLGYNAVQRLRSAFQPPLDSQEVNVAVVPADPGAPLTEFAAALAEALGAMDPLLYVNAERFDAELGAGTSADDVDAWDATDRKVVQWVCDQERRHRFILYEADLEYTPWTRRCIRMADRVLIVARASSEASMTDGERHLFEGEDASVMVAKELVLIHDDDAELPNGTAAWLAQRPQLDRVHHVKLGVPENLRRLARFLARRAVGVVLGGGGARGAAQIGAVQALRDAGIPVDLVGGTSAGGGVAGMVALGWPLDIMKERYRRAFVTIAPFSKYTFPYHSFLSKKGAEIAAKFLYGDARIEDLWIDFFCVTCDLIGGEMVILREGLLSTAVLATTALPGVLPPVLSGGRLLVDGGIMDNNPVALMRARNEGPVVLIDVGQAEAKMIDDVLHDLPSNLASWWHRLKPFGRRTKVPTIPEILVRTMTVARPDADSARQADLYVRPEVDAFGMTDFSSQNKLVAIGYNATMDALEAKAGDERFRRRFGLAVEELTDLPRMELPKDLPVKHTTTTTTTEDE